MYYSDDIQKELEQLLWEVDPIGICQRSNFPAPSDEYQSEVKDLLANLNKFNDLHSLQKYLLGLFQKWFSDDIAGTFTTYKDLAEKLFPILRREGLVKPR